VTPRNPTDNRVTSSQVTITSLWTGAAVLALRSLSRCIATTIALFERSITHSVTSGQTQTMEGRKSRKDRRAIREFLFSGTRILSVRVPEPEPKEFFNSGTRSGTRTESRQNYFGSGSVRVPNRTGTEPTFRVPVTALIYSIEKRPSSMTFCTILIGIYDLKKWTNCQGYISSSSLTLYMRACDGCDEAAALLPVFTSFLESRFHQK
jgi:hypothetical protein